MGYSSVGEAIPQLANLGYDASSLGIGVGNQNFTHCCVVAVNQSLNVNGPNGSLAFNTPSYFLPSLTIDDLQSSISEGMFPCGATWNGNLDGAPIVRVPYSYCRSQCGGWEMSSADILSQWIGPLVQFILPSLAFCLNIPRARKIAIPNGVFQGHPRTIIGLATYWIRLLWAMFLMTLDTFAWLSICLAFAGPMLLSAVYEFVLDRKVLEFLEPPKEKDKRETPVISKRLKAQLLLAVVVGNVRISTGRRVSTLSYQGNQPERDTEVGGVHPPTARHQSIATTATLSDNSWSRIMTMVDEAEDPCPVGKVLLSTKLKAILNSQASFGSTMGASILFFVGGFIYTTIDIRVNSLGDNDTAHALAFGMWWMTIPHLAIVSCAFLAAESPSALQGIVWDGGIAAERDKFERGFWDSVKSKAQQYSWTRWCLRKIGDYELVESTYDGQFKTVSLWNRGANKRRWVLQAVMDYTSAYDETAGSLMSPEKVRKGLKESPLDVFNVAAATTILLVVPSLLALLTSYNTPRKGMACRSLTYLIYGISQIIACFFWVWEFRMKIHYGERWSEAHTRAKTVNWVGQMVIGVFSIFAAVVGTTMQLLGVYRTCACLVPVSYWLRPNDPGSYVDLSTDNHSSIEAAIEWWVTTGAVAVGFMCLVCALGWWHQRRLRKLFVDEAQSLDEVGGPPSRAQPQLFKQEA